MTRVLEPGGPGLGECRLQPELAAAPRPVDAVVPVTARERSAGLTSGWTTGAAGKERAEW